MGIQIPSLTEDLVQKVERLSGMGFSRESIKRMTGVEDPVFDLWIASGAASFDVPENQRQKSEPLFARFFSAIRKAPGDNIYFCDKNGRLQIR